MNGELHFSSPPGFGSFYSFTKITSELHEKAVPCTPRHTVQTVCFMKLKGITTTAFSYHLQIRHNYVILRFKVNLG